MTIDIELEARHRARLQIADRIRLRMAELDRTPVWLARVIGVDLSVVSRWLSGEKAIPNERLREIGIALHRRVEWFVQPDEPVIAA